MLFTGARKKAFRLRWVGKIQILKHKMTRLRKGKP
jgi:hypothetical protein